MQPYSRAMQPDTEILCQQNNRDWPAALTLRKGMNAPFSEMPPMAAVVLTRCSDSATAMPMGGGEDAYGEDRAVNSLIIDWSAVLSLILVPCRFPLRIMAGHLTTQFPAFEHPETPEQKQRTQRNLNVSVQIGSNLLLYYSTVCGLGCISFFISFHFYLHVDYF